MIGRSSSRSRICSKVLDHRIGVPLRNLVEAPQRVGVLLAKFKECLATVDLLFGNFHLV